MVDVKLDIKGIDIIREKILELGRRGASVEGEALKAGGEVLRQAIEEKAPRSAVPRQPRPGTQSWRTGQHAADNIKVSKVLSKKGMKLVRVGIQPGDTSRYFYLKFKEWGSSKEQAEPFMEPARVESKSAIESAIKAKLKEGLGL